MWEFCIQIKKKHSELALFVFEKIKKEIGSFGGIVTQNDEGENIELVLACNQYDQSRLRVFTSNALIEGICIYFKEEFLCDKLNLPIKDGLYFNALKKALLSFDKETDAFLIAKQLELDNTLNLEAFYYFKLKALREKWSELASIANDNGYFLIESENFVELLKFLVDNLEIANDTVNVYFEGEKFKIIDDLDKVFDLKEGEDIVSSIIGLSPKHINFYGGEKDEKVSLLCQIFDKRICFKNSF